MAKSIISALVVFGTRPEAIKMAPVVRELLKESAVFRTTVCVTAQHREMLDQVLNLFDIRPDFDLNIMKAGQDLFDVTSGVLKGLKKVIDSVRPDILFVHGDTTTTMAAGLAGYYCKVPVAHVEAGLRTGERYSPFPEEINRKLTGAIAEFHFSPTDTAKHNLLKEGVAEEAIWVTGNTVIDALLTVVKRVREDATIKREMDQKFNFVEQGKKIILVTGHRRENFGKGLENVCWALKEIAARHSDVEVIYSVHPNPNVDAPVRRILYSSLPNMHLIPPLEYLPFVCLMDRSYLIISDSGGIQEEAPSLGKPVLVTRGATERPEAVEAGTVRLVGTDREKIIKEAELLLSNPAEYEVMSRAHNPYGNGNAAKKIVRVITDRMARNTCS